MKSLRYWAVVALLRSVGRDTVAIRPWRFRRLRQARPCRRSRLTIAKMEVR